LQQAGLLSLLALREERKVRTPQGSIAGNTRHSFRRIGQVQQKVCTGNAVVKPGKLYTVQRQVNLCLRTARSKQKGRRFEFMSNCEPR